MLRNHILWTRPHLDACPAVLGQREGGSGPLPSIGGIFYCPRLHTSRGSPKARIWMGQPKHDRYWKHLGTCFEIPFQACWSPTTNSVKHTYLLRLSSSWLYLVLKPISSLWKDDPTPLFSEDALRCSVVSCHPQSKPWGPPGDWVWLFSSWAVFAATCISWLCSSCLVSLCSSVDQTWSPEDPCAGALPTSSWSWLQGPLLRAPPWPCCLSCASHTPTLCRSTVWQDGFVCLLWASQQ